MRYFLDGTWAAIDSTVCCLCPGRNAPLTAMAFRLQSLLDLRRNAESEAKGAFDRAMAARVMEVAEQSRLVAMWRAACGAHGRNWRDKRQPLPPQQLPRPERVPSTVSAYKRMQAHGLVVRRITGQAPSPPPSPPRTKHARSTKKHTRPAKRSKSSKRTPKPRQRELPNARPRAQRGIWRKLRTSSENRNSQNDPKKPRTSSST